MAITAGVSFGILTMLCYGLSDIFAKKAMKIYDPITALKVDIVIGTIMLSIYPLLFVSFPSLTLGSIALMLFMGVLATISWIAFYRALRVGKVSIVSPIASGWGIIPFILGIVFLSEQLATLEIFSAIAIFAGILLASTNLKELANFSKEGIYPGVGLAVLSLLGFGLSTFLLKFVIVQAGPFYTAVITRLGAILTLLVYPNNEPQKKKFDMRFVWILVMIGFFDSVAYISFNFGILVGYIAIVSAIASATPLVVVLLAHLIFKERLEKSQYLGVALIVLGFIGLSLF